MPLAIVLLVCAMAAAACGDGSGGLFTRQYEYEEEVYLSLDGSAQVNVNASVPALVALRGADLPIDPRARIDRETVRSLFSGADAEVSTPTFSRRDGRRFVHVRVKVADVRRLSRIPGFAWSTYRFERQGDVFAYSQVLGKAVNRPVSGVGWDGTEIVSFRMHLPSEIPFHNSTEPLQRGNILEWDQPLSDRLSGTPLDLQVQLEPTSILYTTLLLFGSTVIAAALTFAVVIWWVVRRGRHADMVESRS